MVHASTTLPHWDMSVVYPSIDAPEVTAGIEDIRLQIEEVERLAARSCAVHHQGRSVDDEAVAAYGALTDALNSLGDALETINAFVHGYTAVDSRHDQAQARQSELRRLRSRLSKVMTRYTAWVGSLNVDELIARSEVARDHQYAVRRAVHEAAHLMPQSEEDLAAELTLSGGSAWGKLHDDLTSQIVVAVEREPDQFEHLPMSEVRNLAMNADRDVRRRAYEAEMAAWEAWATPLTAALNGVTGEHLTLSQRRGWEDVLDESVFQNHIDRATLEVMLGAARAAFPDLRRYLRAKARMLGLDQLTWYDLFAPISADTRVWEWEDGVDFIVAQFGTYSDRMSDLARRAVAERWIDAEPRTGKVGGAFCMSLRGDESRILANYAPSWDGVSTLAHELGHAYHNLCESGRTSLQRFDTPMTLAETASTFCETILRHAAIARGTPQEQLTIL
ncbi:MAG: M3 family metallopeptidase, partial [Chloroflexota bacterium]|nr:M3 family metallopeptidase [Chloroflexota bacterium]